MGTQIRCYQAYASPIHQPVGIQNRLLIPSTLCLNGLVKISGFTFIRNGNILGYPFVSSIRSLLPLCDEVIVNVPTSTDGTLDTVKSINDSKIRIIETEWTGGQPGGKALSLHTNQALDQCTGDWCVYLQGDEVLHESSIPAMRAAMERELHTPNLQGLLVDYTHFYGSFRTEVCSFGWYYKEVRVVRRTPEIRSVGDAQGFRTTAGQKLRVKASGGHYFHYGYALEPHQARQKHSNLASVYNDDAGASKIQGRPVRYYDDDQKVKPFTGSHPDVMKDLVARADWTYASRNPLIRFRREYFWEDVALLIYRGTGIKLGVHKNYRQIA